MEIVAISVPINFRIKILRGILCRTGTQSVESQWKLIAFPVVGVVLSACVQFAENQFPVVPLFLWVVVNRNSSSKILHLDRVVPITGQDNFVSKPFSGFIDWVGKDFKNRMFASLQPIRAKDDARALSDTVCAFESGDTLVAISLILLCCHSSLLVLILTGEAVRKTHQPHSYLS